MESLTSRKILFLASTSSSSSSSDDNSLEETSVSSTSSCDNNFNSSATIHLSSPHRRTIFSSYWKGKDTNLVANCHQNESEKMPIGSSRCILRHPYFELFSESTSFPKHVLVESKYESNPCHHHLDMVCIHLQDHPHLHSQLVCNHHDSYCCYWICNKY